MDKSFIQFIRVSSRLWLKQMKSQSIGEDIAKLMDHKEARKNVGEFKWVQIYFTKLLLYILAVHHSKLSDAILDMVSNSLTWFNEEDKKRLDKSLGVLFVNARSYGDNGQGRLYFPRFSLLSHSCVNNCRHVVEATSPGRFEIRYSDTSILVQNSVLCHFRVYTQKPIAKGEELTITYINLLRHTAFRRARLRERWFFDCQCQRCMDPTELNSGINLIKCPGCHGNDCLLPEQEKKFWLCQGPSVFIISHFCT